jgi:hypothetical protein
LIVVVDALSADPAIPPDEEAPRLGDTRRALDPIAKQRLRGKSQRLSQLQKWAWVELNYRPHAYQDRAKIGEERQLAVFQPDGAFNLP